MIAQSQNTAHLHAVLRGMLTQKTGERAPTSQLHSDKWPAAVTFLTFNKRRADQKVNPKVHSHREQESSGRR